MVDIDERVVSMKFDSSDFEKKSKSTLSILDKLSNKLSFKDAADDSESYLKSISENVDKMAHKSYDIIDMWVEKIKNNIINKFEAFLKENTIGQLQAGWSKYADMTTSVATLKAQGYSMDKITDQLKRLNYFTDETSYQFTKMVGEIGKFTASGQSLEDATTAMMGIAEWAALSGKNASEASRAMYQLSQALGAGTMRLIDYKSIQNLNMDTVEFRKNAIEAALAVGTLKDNLDGTYTSVLNNKITFSLQNFAESLSQGKWFNSKVMMETYKKYSEAVDEIRAIYEEGSYMDAEGNYTKLNTTAEAVNLVKQNNEKLIARFQKTDLRADQINDILKRWKKVEKVTKVTAQEYEAMDDAAKKQLKTMQAQQQENYAAYLKEYAEVFVDAEESAEEALEKWHTYVSDYGIKAFNAAQEAKTFTEAIESAKDAASTVWTTIYTTVFGNYNEAKELWTDLANALYEIFVNRLWDLNDVFEYWKTGGASALENMLDEYEKELASLQSKTSPAQAEIDRMRFLEKEIEKISTELDTVIYEGARTTKTELQGIIDDYEAELKQLQSKESITDFDKQRIKEIEQELVKLNEGIENSIFVNGRKMMFQGIYAIGSGLKSLILNFRKGWDEVSEDNSGGKKLLSFSENLRISAFRFYKFMKNLGTTSFFRNIALGIKHLLAPINGIKQIIKSVIGQFMPAGQTLQDLLNNIAAKFEKITRVLVPSQETLLRFARILRGIVAIIKIIAKAIVGVYQSFIKPVLEPIINALHEIVNLILEALARIGDVAFEIDKTATPLSAMAFVGKMLSKTLGTVWTILKRIATTIIRALAPVIKFLINSLKELWQWISGLFDSSDGESILDKFDKWIDRIKKAWNSTASLAQVFEAFKGGKGLGNFIKMIGAMLDTLVTKIGNTILAIFGLDDAVSKSHMSAAFNSLKSVLVGIAKVIQWLYSNVIRPILIAIFHGIGNAADDLVDAFKKGDFINILETITNIIKTSGLLQLAKLLRIIATLLGSGGLLKIIRNTAKVLESIKRWFNAKYYNEMASVFLKLAISIGIFIGIAVGLTYLPTEKLHEMGNIVAHLTIALLTLIGALILMSKYVEMSKIGLLTFAAAMFSIVALVFMFVYAANKLNEVLSNLFVNKNGTVTTESIGGGVLKVILGLAPLILGVIGVVKLVKMVSVLGVPGLLADFGITIAAIAASIGILLIGLDKLANVINNSSLLNIIASLGIILLMVMVLTRSMGAMFKIAGGNMKVGTSAKQGIAVAISIVAIIASISFILVPLLEDLSTKIDKFGDYMLALIEVCASIVTVSAAFSLMTKHTGNGITILMAGIVFERLMKVLKDYVVPMIKSMSEIGAEALLAIPAVAILILIVAGVAKAVKSLLEGIADIVRAASTVNPKAWVQMALNVAIIMGTLAGIILLFNMFNVEMKVSDVLLLVGSVVAILLALGLFAKIADMPNAVRQDNIRKTFKSMTILVAVIMLAIAGIVAEVNLLYGEKYEQALEIMRTYLLTTAGILIVTLGGLFLFMNNIAKTMGTLDVTKTEALITSIKTCVWGLAAIIGLFSAGGLLAGLVYNNSEDYVSNVIATAGSICGMILTFLIGVSIFVLALNSEFGDNVWGQVTGPHKLKALVAGLIALVSTIAVISLLFMPALKNLTNIPYENILSATIGVSLIIFVLMGMITNLSKSITKGNFDLVGLIAGIGSFLISFAVIMLLIPKLFDAFNNIRGIETGDIIAGFAMILIPLGALILLVEKFSAPGVGEMFMSTSMKIASSIALIAAAMSALAVAMAFVKEIFNPGSTFISGYFAVKGLSNGIKSGKNELANATNDTLVGNTLDLYKEEVKEASPSKEFKKVGKYIDIGLAQGITKDAKTVAKASTKLAETTNEAFCDELGIQSPSKVFYENGRFVVRGFINGINSESNKNKQAGLDMAEGFSEGMEDAMDGFKEDFKGLWSEFKMDADIEKALEGFGENAGGLLSNSLFDNFFGGSSELSESEKQTYKIISNQFNNAFEAYRDNNKKYQDAVRKLQEAQTDYNNNINNREKYSKLQAAKKALQDAENEVLNSFLDESDEKLKKNKGNAIDYRSMYNRITEMNARGAQGRLTTELTTSIGQVATNLMNDGNLMGMFDSLGSDLGGNVSLGFLGVLAETFGIDPNGDIGDQITTKVNGWLSGFGLTGNIGDDVQNGISNLCDWISGESKEGGLIANAGDSLASGLFAGAQTAAENFFQSIIDKMYGVGNYQKNIANFEDWYEKNAESLGLTVDTKKGYMFYHQIRAAVAKFGDEGILDPTRWDEYAKSFNELGDDWQYIKHLKIDEGFGRFNEGNGVWKINYEEKKADEKNEEKNKEITELTKKQFANIIEGAFEYDAFGIGEFTDYGIQEISKYYDTMYKKAKSLGLINENGAFTKGNDPKKLEEFQDYLKTHEYRIEYETEKQTKEINELLKSKDYKEIALTEDEVKAIWNYADVKLDAMRVTGDTLKDKLENYPEKAKNLLQYINDNVIKLVKLQDGEVKSTYDLAQDIAKKGGKDYLDKLSKAAFNGDKESSKQLNKLTGGVSYSEFMKAIKEDYDWLTYFTKTHDYGKLDAEQKKEYDKRIEFYEKNFGMSSEKPEIKETEEKPKTTTTSTINPKRTQSKAEQLYQEGLNAQEPTSDAYNKQYEVGLAKAEGEINGQIDGLTSSDSINAVNDAHDTQLEEEKDHLKINSPSYVYYEEIGEPIGEAIVDGETDKLESNDSKHKIDDAFSIMLKYFTDLYPFKNGTDKLLSGELESTFSALNPDGTPKVFSSLDEMLSNRMRFIISLADQYAKENNIDNPFGSILGQGDLKSHVSSKIVPVVTDYSSIIENMARDLYNRIITTSQKTKDSALASAITNNTNYSSEFTAMQNEFIKIAGTLESIEGRLQEGGLVDLNISGDIDTNNLFDVVIKKGEENWKRTGKQQFKW